MYTCIDSFPGYPAWGIPPTTLWGDPEGEIWSIDHRGGQVVNNNQGFDKYPESGWSVRGVGRPIDRAAFGRPAKKVDMHHTKRSFITLNTGGSYEISQSRRTGL